MRDSCIFYRSFYEAIKEVPDKNKIEIYEAIFEYSLNKNEIETEGLTKTIFCLIKPQLQANWSRFENGIKPKKSRIEAKPKQNRSKTETNVFNVLNVLNENVNENVNEKPILGNLEKFDFNLSNCNSKTSFLTFVNKSKEIKAELKDKIKIEIMSACKNEFNKIEVMQLIQSYLPKPPSWLHLSPEELDRKFKESEQIFFNNFATGKFRELIEPCMLDYLKSKGYYND